MEEIEYADLMQLMASNIDTKIHKYNDDQLYLFCGYEGGGKSTVSISSKCCIDKLLGRVPRKEHIIMDFKEYLTAIYQHMIKQMGKENQEEVELWKKAFNFDMSEEDRAKLFEKDYMIEKGTLITYDEAAAEAGARRSMSSENVDQQNLLIRMRYLGESQFYCCPKPQSLDNYAREQRPRGMFWCIGEYKINYDTFPPKVEDRLFDLYFYDKDKYLSIFKQKFWWLLFASNYDLIKHVKPSFRVILPKDLRELIPQDIRTSYDAKKSVYNASKTFETWKKYCVDEKDKKNGFDTSLVVREGENKKIWYERLLASGKSVNPSYYHHYNIHGKGGKKYVEPD